MLFYKEFQNRNQQLAKQGKVAGIIYVQVMYIDPNDAQ